MNIPNIYLMTKIAYKKYWYPKKMKLRGCRDRFPIPTVFPGGNTDAYREMRIAWNWGRYTEMNPTHQHMSRLCVVVLNIGEISKNCREVKLEGFTSAKCHQLSGSLWYCVQGFVHLRVVTQISVVKSRSLGWRDGAQQNLPTKYNDHDNA